MAQKITNERELKNWLQDQPRQVAIAIACRAALRVLPTSANTLKKDRKKSTLLILHAFRAIAISRIGALGIREKKLFIGAALSAAHSAGRLSNVFMDVAATASTAFAAARAAAFAVARYDMNAVNDTIYYATQSTVGDTATHWNAVINDIEFVSHGLSVQTLMIRPLWPGGTPARAQELWDSMKSHLLARNGEHWEVWTHWYDARLDPSKKIPCYTPPIEELERARILIDEDLWEKGPATANAEIKRLIEKYCTEPPLPPPPPPPGNKSKEKREVANADPVCDTPTDEVDYLARAELARVLAAQLNRVWDDQVHAGWDKWDRGRPAPGFVVHLDAPWGGGKTSFAALLSKILNPQTSDEEQPKWLKNLELNDDHKWPKEYRRPWKVVWFNAWQHEHLNPPWWSFYESIRNQLFRSARKNHEWPKWLCLQVKEFFWNLFTKDRVFTIAASIVSLAIAAYLWWWGLVQVKNDSGIELKVGVWGAVLTTLGGLFVGTASLSKLFSGLRRVFMPGLPDAADNWALGTSDPLNRMRAHFRDLLETIHDPVLVIVDDLDRCNPRYVVELIRGMQIVLNSPRAIFLILGDRDWIERAFETVHKEMNNIDVGPEHDFGGRFVEKAIQFSFSLPEISERQRREYMRCILGIKDAPEVGREKQGEKATLPPDIKEVIASETSFEKREERVAELLKERELDEAQRFEIARELTRRAAADETVEKSVRHMLEGLAPLLPANPRQMKRVVNALSVLQEVVRLDSPARHPGSSDWCKLARWVVLMTEWPRSWVTLSRNPELADKIGENSHTLGGHEVEPEVIRLMLGNGLEPPWNEKITSKDIRGWLSPNAPATSGMPWPEKKN